MNIAIAGYGTEGKANYDYFKAQYPDADMTILDEKPLDESSVPKGARVQTGPNVFDHLEEFDLVVRTAGLSPRKLQTDAMVWSATNEFFKRCKATIIGVTGTKGKGTTSSLIAAMLRAAGRTTYLVGNIGISGLTVLDEIQPDDMVVYELSSFQLWDLERSPQIAVVLPIEPDHLDVHKDMDEYVMAKSHIALHQRVDDIIIYNKNNEYSKQIASRSQATTKRAYPRPLSDTVKSALQLPGAHNEENLSAAVEAVRDFIDDDATMAQGIQSFTGLNHRLKFVGEVNSVQFYDDSIATTPGSAIAALASFEAPKVLILGGSDKGASYDNIILKAKETDSFIIAMGQTGEKIAERAHELDTPCQRVAGSMEDVVKAAYARADKTGVVILSPASASFDMFKNYGDRGDQFIAAVANLQES